ncbi:hypothetical protein EGK14_17750 [Erwinia sp. 198]|nr:hypothetical protein EGK14_17750 [Erwinia sp. 198]
MGSLLVYPSAPFYWLFAGTVYHDRYRMTDSETTQVLSNKLGIACDSVGVGDWTKNVNVQGESFLKRDERAMRT